MVRDGNINRRLLIFQIKKLWLIAEFDENVGLFARCVLFLDNESFDLQSTWDIGTFYEDDKS